MDALDPMAHTDPTPGATTGPSDDSTPAAEPPAAQPAVIDLFADTGHHFAFVPLTSRQAHDNPELEKLCRNNDFPWGEARDRSGAPLRWLRYQFAQREIVGTPTDQSGVLLAVETNQGTAHRGWALQPEEVVSSTDAARYTPADKLRTPYVFPDATRQPPGGVQKLTVYLPLTPAPARDSSALGRWVSFDLEIHWLESVGKVVDVDLIVDFGNTRSVALLLARSQAAHGTLSEITQPVRFWLPQGGTAGCLQRSG